jgi:hypothetical protein
MTLINWLLKPKYMLNIFCNCFCCMKVQYDVFLFFDRVGRMHEKKYFFFVFDIIFLQYFKENQIFYYRIYIFTVYKYKSI